MSQAGTIIVLGLAAVLVVMVSIVWPTRRGAPWVPTVLVTVPRMLALADIQPGELVYDLGSGDGRMLIVAARRFGARAVGVEIDPWRYLWTKMLILVLRLRGQVQVIRGDLFDQDVSEADVVTVYLTKAANKKLKNKLESELHSGGRVVSHLFTFPGWPIARTDAKADLYLYRMEEVRNAASLSDRPADSCTDTLT